MATFTARTAMAAAGAAALMAVTAAANPAAAAPKPGETGWGGTGVVETNLVIEGAADFERGNRHQVKVVTTGGQVSGYIRSYFCPTGATVTDRWASSKCVHRGTARAVSGSRITGGELDGPMQWISSTGKSALQTGAVVYRKPSGAQFGVAMNFTHFLGTKPASTFRGGIGHEGGPAYDFTAYRGFIRTS